MKKTNLLYLLSITLVLAFPPAFADGQDGSGGGDECENRIQIISNDISSWISNGGAENLDLPSGLIARDYEEKMLNSMSDTVVSCNDEKVFIGRSQKTCKNFTDEEGVKRIQCDYNRFNKYTDEQAYRTVHHEHAGIARVEFTEKESSSYYISNQISAYLEEKVVKRLAVKAIERSFSISRCIEEYENEISIFRKKFDESPAIPLLAMSIVGLPVAAFKISNADIKTDQLEKALSLVTDLSSGEGPYIRNVTHFLNVKKNIRVTTEQVAFTLGQFVREGKICQDQGHQPAKITKFNAIRKMLVKYYKN